MQCPQENALLECLEGRLARERRAVVEAHIDGCHDCFRLYAELARGRSALRETPREVPPAPAAAGEPREGQKISRYLLRRRLGAGSRGAVFEAVDPMLERRLALRLVHTLADEGEPGARVLSAARAMARLTHPNVVAVHDVGRARGCVFIAMDFIEGTTLAGWLQEQRRSWPEVLDAFVRAGRGLLAAHAAGLVHGDFEPGSVLLGEDGRLCVGDFGLLLPEGHDTEPSLPPAAAREQQGAPPETDSSAARRIAGEPPSSASDVYGFCASLWAALDGQPDVPAGLRAVVERGLAEDPAGRPALRALLAELSRERGASAGAPVDEPGPADAFLQRLEISGGHAAVLVREMASFQALAGHAIAREGVGRLLPDGSVELDPAGWYPALPFVRAARRVAEELGPRAAFELGVALGRRQGPAEGDIEAGLRALDRAWLAPLRFDGRPLLDASSGEARGGRGRFRVEHAGERLLEVLAEGIWPCDLDRGIVTGSALRLRSDAIVTHPPTAPCRKRGDSACRHLVRWGAPSAAEVAPGPEVPRLSLRAARGLDEFVFDPFGRYLAGKRCFYACPDPQLFATVFWGAPDAEDLTFLERAFSALLRPESLSHASLIDLRRAIHVAPDAYEAMAASLRRAREAFSPAVRAQAVLRPAGMAGALIAGYFEVERPPYPVRIFTEPAEALTFLGRADPALVAELDAIAAMLSQRG